MHKYNSQYTYTETNRFKLLKYIKEIYKLLNLNLVYIEDVCSRVVVLVESILQDGSKRGKNRDAIIMTCIKYINKQLHYTFDNQKHVLNIPQKYMSKSEKVLAEYIHKQTF